MEDSFAQSIWCCLMIQFDYCWSLHPLLEWLRGGRAYFECELLGEEARPAWGSALHAAVFAAARLLASPPAGQINYTPGASVINLSAIPYSPITVMRVALTSCIFAIGCIYLNFASFRSLNSKLYNAMHASIDKVMVQLKRSFLILVVLFGN